jgi:hypothetical protein
MADLSFANLNTANGTPFITASGSQLTIDCSALMGEATIALTDTKVAEFMTRLMDTAAAAQIAYNANPANPSDITSYPEPFAGVPTRDPSDGVFYVASTYSFTSRAPLNKAASTAVTA